MPLAVVSDASADDFAAGTADAGAYVARSAAGEVVLRPKVAGEFTGDALPDGWSVTPWLEGGTGTLDGGKLVLDGARVGCDALLLSPCSIEIAAVFAARPDQHAGFGTNFVDVPWVMFSTKWGRRLYGRTHLLNLEDKKLSGDWLGAPHIFRIDWNVLDIIFSVDGARLAHFMVPVPGHMRGLAANQRLGGPPLRVEWIRISPYPPAGRFTSRVLDAGTGVEWTGAAWRTDTPEGTAVDLHVRTGDTPAPDDCTWSAWRRLPSCATPVGRTSRYAQYRADLTTADPSRTPVLRSVELRYRPA
ncbi:MAG TPA: hypothetical protein VHT97_03360 [Acidimicrobiales bacterium]|nr:hypothetical protein [Acidimicrobiales bacterium]